MPPAPTRHHAGATNSSNFSRGTKFKMKPLVEHARVIQIIDIPTCMHFTRLPSPLSSLLPPEYRLVSSQCPYNSIRRISSSHNFFKHSQHAVVRAKLTSHLYFTILVNTAPIGALRYRVTIQDRNDIMEMKKSTPLYRTRARYFNIIPRPLYRDT